MKQTAVEWFEDQVGHNSLMGLKEFNEIFEKAKEMEKDQIIEACNEWFTEGCRYATGFEQTLWQDEEDYYNQTFNNETDSSGVVG
jgi:hypothetical protein